MIVKRSLLHSIPWASVVLLMTAYASFGWFLCSYSFPEIDLLPSGLPLMEQFDRILIKPTLPKVFFLAAMGGILLLSTAFISPLSSFSRLVGRWFSSDTVAFLAICVVAGSFAVILFWMKIFYYILTIVATEALVRIDMQTLGHSGNRAFWTLCAFSSTGLIVGWLLRIIL